MLSFSWIEFSKFFNLKFTLESDGNNKCHDNFDFDFNKKLLFWNAKVTNESASSNQIIEKYENFNGNFNQTSWISNLYKSRNTTSTRNHQTKTELNLIAMWK
jgi:hypothetical protein